MAKNEYVIRIDYNVQDSTEEATPTSAVQDATTDTKKAKKKEKDNTSKAVAAYMTKQALSYAVSNYGNLTGDYIAQANIQGAIEIGGLIGLAATGPIGAVAAATGLVLKAASQEIEIYKKNIETENLRMRVGLVNYSGGRL